VILSLRRDITIPLGLLGLLAIGALTVPLFATADPRTMGDVVAQRFLSPFTTDDRGVFHLLGTDRFGRDILARTMLAARVSLIIGFLGSILAGGVGIGIGALAAWSGGFVDRVLMGVADALLAIPRLILLLVCAALWQPGTLTVIAVLVVTG
jgi:peptide/nickel transport system permease protein